MIGVERLDGGGVAVIHCCYVTGTINPIADGGQLVPITYTVDFSKYTPGSDPEMGVPAMIRIDGAAHQVLGAILARDYLSAPLQLAGPFVYNQPHYNTAALP